MQENGEANLMVSCLLAFLRASFPVFSHATGSACLARREITKISSRSAFIYYHRAFIGSYPNRTVNPRLKSQTSSQRSPECVDARRSSPGKSGRSCDGTLQLARRPAMSSSGSAGRVKTRWQRTGGKKCGIPFHLLVFISMSCCAFFGIGRQAGDTREDEVA